MRTASTFLYKDDITMSLTAFLISILSSFVVAKTSAILTSNRTIIFRVHDGGVETIYCNVQGILNASVSWEVDGNKLYEANNDADHINFNMSKNGSLIIMNPLTNWKFGLVNITCIANSTAGNITIRTSYQVILLKAATITTDKKMYDVPDDGTSEIELNCKATGFPSPVISWSIKESILSKGLSVTYRDNGTKSLNVTAVFNDGCLRIMTSQRNKGFGMNVTCVANNTAGDERKTFLVRFLKAPRILTNGSKIAIIVYMELFIDIACETLGYPKPFIEWKFGNHRLNASHGYLVGNNVIEYRPDGDSYLTMSSYKVFNNGTIRINNPRSTSHVPHEIFTCIARNIAGEVYQTHGFYIGKLESYSFEVVLPKEQLISNLQETVEQRINKVFQPGKLYYSLNITSINFISRTVHFQLTWMEEKLKMAYGEPRDFAKLAEDVFRAISKNGGFNVERFQMNAPPAPPVDLNANEITSDEVTISWKPPNYFEIEFYQVQMSSGSSSKWKNMKRVNGDRKSATLDNLEPDTKYLIRIESGNKHGVGEKMSENLLVETKAASRVVIIVVVVILVVVLVLGSLVAFVYYRRRKKHRFENHEGSIEMENNPYEDSIPGVAFSNIYVRNNRTFCPTGTSDGSSEHAVFSWNEISREFLCIDKILGQGEFGLVQKAMWNDEENNQVIPVAVKTVQDFATETDRKELFKELKLMAGVAEHPNVVNLVGACSKGGPLLVVVEFCEHGDLLMYLKKNRKDLSSKQGTFVTSLEPLTRLRIAFDVSKGMSYLEEKKVVHRDLAARNVLLGKNNIAKVSDFGLSRDIYERGLYEKKTGGKLPVKWMAIESLQEASYDSKSDVWSFGILVWEIESAGLVPYPGIHGVDLLPRLQEGYRLPKPSETSSEIYEVMKSCWDSSPKARPYFKDLVSILESCIEERSGYLSVLVDEEDSSVGANASYVNYEPK